MIFYFLIPIALCVQNPNSNYFGWTAVPVLHQPHPVRSTEARILLLWSAGVHSIAETVGYELEVSWPTGIAEYDWEFYPRPSVEGVFPESTTTDRDWATSWSAWYDIYTGLGRQFEFRLSEQLLSGLVGQRVFDFRVRALCDMASCESEWSNTIHAHVELATDRFGIELIGTGRNNVGVAEINVNGESVFHRSDLTGLTMAVFDRSTFALHSIKTYNTQDSKSESTDLSNDVRAIGPGMLICIVSSGAWEWNFTPIAASALEQIGGYYVGQWSRVFSVTSIQFNPYADIAETASEDAFGHPYALMGYFGLGMGNGWESLQLNTGHYLALGKAQPAIIRAAMYYNYMLGRFVVGKAETSTDEFFTKSQLPLAGSVHAPVPASRTISAAFQVHAMSIYAPYVGNLWNQLEYIMETNETVYLPQYNASNYGFEIVISLWLPSPLVANDPRTGDLLQTELERMWGGPTARVSGIDGVSPLPGAVLTTPDRPCVDALTDRFDVGSCTEYDDPVATAESPLMQYGVGMWPAVCSITRDGCEEQVSTYTSIVSAPVLSGTPSVSEDFWS